MARIVARNATILMDGVDLTGRSNSVRITFSTEAPEVTAFRESFRTRLSAGLQDAEMTVDGFYDTGADGLDAQLSNYRGASAVFAFFPRAPEPGQRGKAFGGILTSYEINAATAEAVATTISVTSEGWFVHGRSLGEYTDTGGASATGSSVDFGAPSGSGFATLHVLGLDLGGATYLGASLQHSSDGTTWVTLLEFSPATASGFGDYQVFSSASRYRRLKWGFSPSTGTSVHLVGFVQA